MTISLEFTEVSFPDSDGKPMAENTEQFQWIVLIKENLEILFADDPNVFVAGDLLWYPVKSRLIPPVAPDAMVALGRPKGRRGSYKQWEEDNIPPQVVFEVLSPCNDDEEMARKLEFYDTYGAQEYYQYDPDTNKLKGWQRRDDRLVTIVELRGWHSPLLGIRFEPEAERLRLYYPDGQPFRSPIELDQQVKQERRRAEQEQQRAEQERQRAEQERQRAEQERQKAERLAEQLRALGVEVDDL